MNQQTEVDWVVSWIERISQVGFGVSLGLILFGSYLGIWIWGRVHRERIAELVEEIRKLEADRDEWKHMALGLLAPLETMKNRLPQKPRG